MPSGEKTPKQIPPAMEARKWKPGQSGNPASRPRKIISEAYLRRMASPLPEDVCKAAKLRKGSTWADLAALSMAKAAVKGRVDAAREIADRLEGKATQPVEVTGEEDGSVSVLAVWAERQARLKNDSGIGPRRSYAEFQLEASRRQRELEEADGGEHEH